MERHCDDKRKEHFRQTRVTGVDEGGVRVVVKEGESHDVSTLGIHPTDTHGAG